MQRWVATLALLALLTCISLVSSTPALAATSAGPPQWAITSVAGPAYFKPPQELEGEVTEKSKVVKGLSSSASITVEAAVTGTKVKGGTTVTRAKSVSKIAVTPSGRVN